VAGDHARIDGHHHATMEIRCSTTTLALGHRVRKPLSRNVTHPPKKFRRGRPISRDERRDFYTRGLNVFGCSKHVVAHWIARMR
jgi:hypothetical protein